MRRFLWVVGEIVAGVLVGGFLSGGVVPLAMAAGVSTGPWMIWTSLAIGIGACILGGERLRKSLKKT